MSDQGQWRGVWKILRFAKRHWLLIAAALGATAAFAYGEYKFFRLMEPFLDAFSKLRKNGEQVQDIGLAISQIYDVGLKALILGPAIALAALAQDYLRGRVVWTLVVDMRNAICRCLMPQSLSFFEGRRSGDLMSRIMNDVSRSQGVFTQLFSNLPEGLGHLVLGVVLAAYNGSWRLTLLTVLAGPFVVFPIGYLAKRIRRYGRAGLEKLSDLTDLMSQMFSGIRVIKAFKMEDAETQEFERVNDRFRRKMLKMVTAQGLSAGTIESVARISIAVGVIVGAWYLDRHPGSLDMKRLIYFVGGTYFIFFSIRKLVKAYSQLQDSIPATDRILELLEEVPQLQDGADAVPLARMTEGIVFEDVSFGYNSEAVLRNVSLEIKKGETVAIVGRSGAGKSTLVALIPRFYDVTEGAVKIDGRDIRRIQRETLLDHIALVTQQTFLFNRSIAENLRYGKRDATQEELEAAARAANIHDFIVSLPDGYHSLCGEFGTKLSGGQRQRIAIARAILKNADILILDEAMAGLDVEAEALVNEALTNLMNGRTTLVITHDLATIRNADKILVLRDGYVVEQGTHAELMALNGEYRTLAAFDFGLNGSN